MQRDRETGIEYQEIDFPKYKIGDEVIYPHHAKYQKPYDIEINSKRLRSQLILGTIIGATYNPDSGNQWRYFIKSSLTVSPQ